MTSRSLNNSLKPVRMFSRQLCMGILLFLLIVLLTLFYMITHVDQCKTEKCDPQLSYANNYTSSNDVSTILLSKPVNDDDKTDSLRNTVHSLGDSAKIFEEKVHALKDVTNSLKETKKLPSKFLGERRKSQGEGTSKKTEQWYLSAIDKLPFKMIMPSSLFLNEPYFKPDSNTRFDILDWEIISPSRCAPKAQMVIFILSEPNSFETRTAIRQTWGSVASSKQWPWANFKMDIQLLFVVGVRFETDPASPRSPLKLWKEKRLRNEAAIYDDILQLSTEDRYYNLTRKVISGFKWINKNCPVMKYVMKADQDIFVNVPLVWQFLKHYGQNNTIYGYIYTRGVVARRGRWSVSKSVLPLNQYPDYASGTAYIMSFDAIAKVLNTYHLFPYVFVEDAFITGIMAVMAKINRYHVTGFTKWLDKRLDSCQLIMDRVYATNRLDVANLKKYWNEIKSQGHGRCV